MGRERIEMINWRKLTDEQVAVLTSSLESQEFHKDRLGYTKFMIEVGKELHSEAVQEYRRRKLHYSMFHVEGY